MPKLKNATHNNKQHTPTTTTPSGSAAAAAKRIDPSLLQHSKQQVMDLQAILDASSTSSSSDDGGGGGMAYNNKYGIGKQSSQRLPSQINNRNANTNNNNANNNGSSKLSMKAEDSDSSTSEIILSEETKRMLLLMEEDDDDSNDDIIDGGIINSALLRQTNNNDDSSTDDDEGSSTTNKEGSESVIYKILNRSGSRSGSYAVKKGENSSLPSYSNNLSTGGNNATNNVNNSGSVGGGGSNNLELERILMEADDDDDDYENGEGEHDDDNNNNNEEDVVMTLLDKHNNNNNNNNNMSQKKSRRKQQGGGGGGKGREFDILRSILNEADDDDDDDNRDDHDSNSINVNSIMMNSSSQASGSYNNNSLMMMHHSYQQQPTTIPLSHSMEVDAILNSYDEEDDDDDNEEDSHHEVNGLLDDDDEDGIGNIPKFLQNSNINKGLTMVESMENDSEASFGLNLNFSSSSNIILNNAATAAAGGGGGASGGRTVRPNIEAIEENISMQFPLKRGDSDGGIIGSGKDIFIRRGEGGGRSSSSSSFLKDCTTDFLQRVRSKDEGDSSNAGGGGSPKRVGGGSTTYQRIANLVRTGSKDGGDGGIGKGEDSNSNISARCLHQAQLSEQRLLKPNNRNIVSPLTVKRRMKPKVELLTKSRKNTSTSHSSQYTPQRINQQQGQPRFGFSGIIQSKTMIALGSPKGGGAASSTSSAGLPTALAISSKFIAVGTQRGVIKVYDFYEQLKMSLGEDRNILAVVGKDSSSRGGSGGGGGGASGNSGDEWAALTGSVTSIDLSPNGDYLLAGYGTGKIILWDIIKGSILNSSLDLHTSSISSVRLNALPMGAMGGSRQNDNKEIGAISVDANGIVNKLTFSKGMLWSTYSLETELLLDGTAGQILAVDSLPSFDDSGDRSSSLENMDYHPSVYKIVLIALSSSRSSFTISVEPKVNVLHRWAGPALERIDPSIEPKKTEDDDDKSSMASSYYASSYASGYASTYASSYATSYASTNASDYASTYVSTSTYQSTHLKGKKEVPHKGPELPFLPILSWGWALVSGGGHAVSPILARAWGCSLQFLRASFPPRDESGEVDDGEIHNPAFGLHDEFDASSPVVALNWLGKRSLVYLTITNEFTIIDTVIMTMQERLDFSGMKLVYAEFALSSTVKTLQLPGVTARTTFMNSIRSNDNRLLILCQEEIKQITVLGMREQIKSLEDGGQWLEALALALDHYESTITSQEDRKRNATSMRHADAMTSSSSLTEDEIWMAELLMRYLTLAIDNAPESSELSPSQMDFAQSHFEMLSGVCIEFCVVTRRLDLLFGPIFRRFYEARFINVFLDVMETYVLNDKLNYIAPEAMVMFVAHCRDMKELSMVERCLLHMDCSLMDFDSILTLLRKNSLYTGLLHVYSAGLNDYVSPLEILFDAIFESTDASDGFHSERRKDGAPTSKFEQYGYKAILYLRYCFEGKSFPKGGAIMPEERVQTLRKELFSLLLTEKATPLRPSAATPHRPASRGIRSLSYPYLRALLLIDAEAFLNCLAIVLDDPSAQFAANARESQLAVDYAPDALLERENTDESGLEISDSLRPTSTLPNKQRIVDTLSSIIMPDSLDSLVGSFRHAESKKQIMLLSIKAKDAFLDFLPKYLKLGAVQTPTNLTTEIFKRLCSKSGSSESEIVSLLQAMPRTSYNLDEVLRTIERAQATRGALFLHKVGVTMTLDRPDMSEKCHHHFNRAVDCYLVDSDEDFRKGVFAYAMKECSSSSSNEASDSSRLFHSIILGRLPELIKLDAVHSARLVGEMFVGQISMIISTLEKMESGRVAYSFLDAIISGELGKMDSVASQELLSNLTSSHHQQYLTLMAAFQPDRVYQYLSTNQGYRLNDALELCQKKKITDASAYLLERMGDVSGALQLMLQTLDTRLVTLRNIFLENDAKSRSFGTRRTFNTKFGTLQNEVTEKEKNSLKQILSAVLDLCERNKNDHVTLENERGPLLWFHVLDRLVNAKGMLRDPKATTSSTSPSSQQLSSSISAVLSELLLMTMQRMIPNVSLYDLLHKITRDHASNDLGEFREMLVSMLKTYSSELDVCSNAVDVMYHDISHMSLEKKRLKVHGSLVQESRPSTRMMTNHAVVTITPTGKWETPSSSSRRGGGNTFSSQSVGRSSSSNQKMSALHTASVLKNRRRKRSMAMKRGRGGGGGGSGGGVGGGNTSGGKLSLMTAFEGEISMDAEHHLVGCLSDAQHVGGFY